MKKYWIKYILALAILFVFAGCKKGTVSSKNSLSVTSWSIKVNADNYITFKFISNTDVKYTERGGGEKLTAEGSYTYNHPDVRIIIDFDDYNLGTVKYRGTISGNKMIITSNIDNYEDELFLTKD